MSAARLSSISSQTLSQLLERQRLQTLGKTPPSSQLTNIKRNLEVLREGILNLERQVLDEEEKEDENASTAALRASANALRNQWERAKRMLGEDGVDIEELASPVRKVEAESVAPSASSSSTGPSTLLMTVTGGDRVDRPYSDDPSTPPSPSPSPEFEPGMEMQTQRQLMDEQDTHLETLSHSIRRQREISENIGTELDVHTGLLEDLEMGIDRTSHNLGGARRRLERVGKGARDNCSAVTIGTLIVVLLILIVIFKT